MPESLSDTARPLVVDLDGTLLCSDLFVESFFALASSRPAAAVRTLLALRHGRARMKAELAEAIDIDLAALPWNEAFLAFLREERARGRRIYLASASAERFVDAVAAHFGLFDGVFASTETVNLKSRAKAEALCRVFGERGFDYAGNEIADLAVWERAGGVLVVNAAPAFRRLVKARWPEAVAIGASGVGMRDYLRAVRVHQWLKNLLVFVPMLAAHQFDAGTLATGLLAFLSFSLCASSVYLLNDLVDLGRDRAHPTKRFRPLASGRLPVMRALVMIPALMAASALLALAVAPGFLGMLLLYYALTLAYSLDLKRRLMVDVVVLACLYGVRLAAGGIAAGVTVSAWLAAFSLFIFCSLALVKRCIELAGRLARGDAEPVGRAYRLRDLPVLEMLAAASGFTAVLVFALYINSDATTALYSAPERLWLICVVLIYWIGRVLVLTHRGEMPDDPVVFAATDRASLVCLGLVLAVVAVSL